MNDTERIKQLRTMGTSLVAGVMTLSLLLGTIFIAAGDLFPAIMMLLTLPGTILLFSLAWYGFFHLAGWTV